MISDLELSRIFDEILVRIQHIGIALLGQRPEAVRIAEHYDLNKTDTPSIGEAEDAFVNWNCAVLTAFRSYDENGKTATLAWNEARNERLKKGLKNDGLVFRSVAGCYREAGWDKPSKEICFFVTNSKNQTCDANLKDFFCKIYRQAEYYDQDSFLFTFPGNNRVAFLVATSDNGRKDLRSDIKFAGPLFTHVPDIGDWTDCSDGRISFRLKGMIQKGGTGNKKVKIGEGDIFDIEGYQPDGLLVIYDKGRDNLKAECQNYHGNVPIVKKFFVKNNITETDIKNKVIQGLKALADKRCRRVGFHCSASLNGSYVDGAKIVLDTIISWASNNNRKFDEIVIVDIYGDYCRMLARK